MSEFAALESISPGGAAAAASAILTIEYGLTSSRSNQLRTYWDHPEFASGQVPSLHVVNQPAGGGLKCRIVQAGLEFPGVTSIGPELFFRTTASETTEPSRSLVPYTRSNAPTSHNGPRGPGLDYTVYNWQRSGGDLLQPVIVKPAHPGPSKRRSGRTSAFAA